MNTTRLATAAVALGLGMTACSGGTADTSTSTPLTTLAPITTTTAPATTTTTTTTTTTLPPLVAPSPLNGLDVGDEALLDRRAIAVKIDNHPNARPQSGLDNADLVYELLVEGGLTRFIAVFHSADSDYVGPIRSGRPTDPTLIRPTGAPLQFSGAQAWVQSIFAAEDVKLIGEGSTTFRIGGRSAPHNLYGDTNQMRTLSDGRGYSDDPPPDQFTFGEPEDGTRAVNIELDWSDRPVVRWEWNGTEYLRSNGTSAHNLRTRDGEETQITTDTLLVLTATRYTASPPSGRSGSSVPALRTTGTGQALLFHHGTLVEGTWERGSTDEPFELLLADGREMVLPRGRLWVSIFPSTQTVDWS